MSTFPPQEEQEVSLPVSRWLGLKRLFRAILSPKGRPSNEIATNWLLILGFGIEAYVLHQLIVHRLTEDFGTGKHDVVLWSATVGAFAVILALLFHQLMIFRNFALPEKIDARNEKRQRDCAVRAVEEGYSKGIVDATCMHALFSIFDKKPEAPKGGEKIKLRCKKALEIAVYCLFGVLTGEAGYLLTVLRETISRPNVITNEVFKSLHTMTGKVLAFFTSFFGTHSVDWGTTLECLFLFCAMIICVTVLIWDWVVKSASSTTEYKRLIKQFISDDRWSLLFWACLFGIVTPRIREFLGEEPNRFVGNYQTERDIGVGIWILWFLLIVCSFTYARKIWTRFCNGLIDLAMQETDEDAAHRKI